MTDSSNIIRVGLIGCGEVAQVVHIPTLVFLSDLYRITYLCDISKGAIEHCASKVPGTCPKTTTSAEELCSSPDVDAVIVCNASSFHHTHAILALNHNKNVFVEKPLALSYRDLDALQAAEDKSKGKVFVGYMRRYAPALAQAIDAIGDQTKINYARIRDIIGQNAYFVNQSGTFPKKFNDFTEADSKALKDQDNDVIQHTLLQEFGIPDDDKSRFMLFILGNLGTHDISAMREAIGMPERVIGADLRWPIWSAMLDYGHFTAIYESGINNVPVFDAHIELYSDDKIVRVNYDTPFVKGLPITITIREKVEGTEIYQERTLRPTYEDPYTIEYKVWHGCITKGKPIKTTIADARKDLDIFKMLMQAYFLK